MAAEAPEIWAQFGVALVLASAIARPARRLSRPAAAALIATIVAAEALIPVAGLTPLRFLLSLTGPLSAATLLLAGRSLILDLVRPPQWRDPLGFAALAAALLALSLAFYPLAVGVGSFDPYRLGYFGWSLPIGLLVLLAGAYALRSPAIAIWIGVAAAAFVLALGPSRNLWDYLIDPIAGLLALLLLIERVRARRSAVRAATVPDTD